MSLLSGLQPIRDSLRYSRALSRSFSLRRVVLSRIGKSRGFAKKHCWIVGIELEEIYVAVVIMDPTMSSYRRLRYCLFFWFAGMTLDPDPSAGFDRFRSKSSLHLRRAQVLWDVYVSHPTAVFRIPAGRF